MKRLYLFISLFLSCAITLFATPRTVQEANAIAEQFLLSDQSATAAQSPSATAPAKPQPLRLTYTALLPNQQDPAFYVFAKPQQGFVLVSADDCAVDILAYSDTGTFPEENIPAHVQFWLDMYAHEIEHAIELKLPRRQASEQNNTYTPVEPLCPARWGQDYPYNNLCPTIYGERTVAGCVATAVAQIMYTHKHPAKGTGSHSYSWNGKTLSANFANTTYQWDKMLPDYVYDYTDEEANAVATLIHHVGVACNMQYNTSASGGSGAYTAEAAAALVDYFGYDAAMLPLHKDYMNHDEMLRLMAEDLQDGNPILMAGSTINNEGHAFVCDGIREDGYLHINWGWDGAYDGYFALSALDPEGQGTGGAASGLAFTESVSAYTKIRPDQGGKASVSLTADIVEWNSPTQPKTELVEIYVGNFFNQGITPYYMLLTYSVYQDGEYYTTLPVTDYQQTLPVAYGYEYLIVPADVRSLPDGQYELSLTAMQEDMLYPVLVAGVGEKKIPFTIANGNVSYEHTEPTPVEPDMNFEKMQVVDFSQAGYPNSFDIYLMTGDFEQTEYATYGTCLYFVCFAKSMTSVVGTYTLDGGEDIGSILGAELYYGNGSSYMLELESGYITISRRDNNRYEIHYELYDIQGKRHTASGIPIWDSNTAAYQAVTTNQWNPIELQNECVSAALPVHKATLVADQSEPDMTTPIPYFVEGVVDYIESDKEEMNQSGTYDIHIRDVEKDERLLLYNTSWLNNTHFTEETAALLQKTDTVIAFGSLYLWEGTTPAMDTGYIYEHHPSSPIPSSLMDNALAPNCEKILYQGQLLIRRGETIYNAQGQIISIQ